MTAFPKYPKYKDSGVEWLGDVPEQWNTEKGKWLFTLMERPPRKDDEIVTAFRDGQVTLRINRRTEGFTNAIKEHGYQGIRKGDLVIHAMDAFAGAIGVSDSDGKSTPVYSACVPRQQNSVNPYFYAYLLRHMAHSGFITTLAKGIRERSTNFSFTDFAVLRLPLPAKREQDRIVAFLDEKTAEIDRLIAKKQRQIELLDEQKAILINRAVTRGLHPHAELQDSGIPWIGLIPKHWKVRKLGAVVSFVSGATPSKDRNDFWNGGVPWISPKDMKRLKIDSSEDTISAAALKHTNIKLLSPGTVLIVVRGMILVRTVPIAVNTVHSTINQDIKGMEVNQAVMSPDFLLTLLTACQEMLTPLIEESGHGTRCLRTESLKTVLLPTPPRDEQDELVIRVQSISDASDKAKSKIESQIQTLQTLRSTLIAHAVTGKIKV